MTEYTCPDCGANLMKQPGFSPSKGYWRCAKCGKIVRVYAGSDDPFQKKQNTGFTGSSFAGVFDEFRKQADSLAEEAARRMNSKGGQIPPDPPGSRKNPGSTFSSQSLNLEGIDRFLARGRAFLFNNKKITLDYPVERLLNMKVTDLEQLLKNSGFDHIRRIPVEDLTPDSEKEPLDMQRISIYGQDLHQGTFTAPFDAMIDLYYHVPVRIEMPCSSEAYAKSDYRDVCHALNALGFTQVYTLELTAPLLKWLKREGEVESVTIRDRGFKAGERFDYNEKILVRYHTRS